MSLEAYRIQGLTPEEAQRRLARLHVQLYLEQMKTNFVVYDVRSDVRLRNEIRAFMEGRIQQLSGWTDPIGQLEEWIVQNVVQPILNALQPVRDWVYGAAKWLLDQLDPIWEALKGAVEWVAGAIWSTMSSFWNWLWGGIQWLGGAVSSSLSSFWNWLWGGLQWLGGVIGQAWHSFWNWLWGGIQWLGGALGQAWTSFWSWLWGGLQWLGGLISQALRPIWEWIWNGLQWLGQQLWRPIERVGALLENLKQQIWEGLKWVWENVLVPAGKALEGAVASAVQAILGAAQGFASQVASMLISSVPHSPEEVPQILIRALVLGTAASAAMAAASVLPELAHPLKHIGIPEVLNTIWRSTGWEHAATAIVSAIMGAGLGLAAQYWANSIAALRVPDAGTAALAVLEEVIDEGTYYTWARYQGYSEDKARVILEVADRPPSARDLRRMVYFGLADKGYVEKALKRSHIEKESVPLLADLYTREAEYARKTALRSVYVKLAQEGVISEDELEQALEATGLTPEEVEVYKKSVARSIQEGLARRRANVAIQSYRRGLISEEQLAQALKEAGYTDDIIQAYVELYRKVPKEDRQTTPREEVRAIGKDVVIARFVEGVIDEREFEDELRTLGYPETEIQRLKLYARLKRDLNLAKDLLSALRDAYRRKKIGDVQFITLARKYGISDEQIQFELATLKLRLGLGLEEIAS